MIHQALMRSVNEKIGLIFARLVPAGGLLDVGPGSHAINKVQVFVERQNMDSDFRREIVRRLPPGEASLFPSAARAAMKNIVFALLLAFASASLVRADAWSDAYSHLLEKYVTPQGVRYAAWKASGPDQAELAKVVSAIAEEKPEGTKDDKLAFYLNAYNANILKQVLEAYPTKSVRDIAAVFGFFTQQRITVSGEKMSFNHLEKDVIHGFSDPRVHFALNCASASCPPLRPKSYSGTALSAELDQQTTAFLNHDPHGVKADNDGKIADASKIFDWYGTDFQAAGGVEGFINKYRKPPLAPDAKISFMNYDWSLNEAH